MHNICMYKTVLHMTNYDGRYSGNNIQGLIWRPQSQSGLTYL